HREHAVRVLGRLTVGAEHMPPQRIVEEHLRSAREIEALEEDAQRERTRRDELEAPDELARTRNGVPASGVLEPEAGASGPHFELEPVLETPARARLGRLAQRLRVWSVNDQSGHVARQRRAEGNRLPRLAQLRGSEGRQYDDEGEAGQERGGHGRRIAGGRTNSSML